MKYFYAHLIEIESLNAKLDELELSKEERMHLSYLADSSLHHKILDEILSNLSDSDKRVFMQHVNDGDHEKIWKFLNEKIEGVEDKIKKAADQLKDELHKDIKEAKEKS